MATHGAGGSRCALFGAGRHRTLRPGGAHSNEAMKGGSVRGAGESSKGRTEREAGVGWEGGSLCSTHAHGAGAKGTDA